MLELHHALISTCSQKVRWVLAEKALPWVDHPVRLDREEHLRPEYLRLNPNGVVPTLVHDGQPVVDSSVINEYLDEVFQAQPLRPAEARFRAFAEQRPLRRDFYLKMGREGFAQSEVDAALRRLRQCFERMAGALADQPWLAGRQLSLADIAMLPTCVRLDDLGLSSLWLDLPRVGHWYRRLCERPAFAATYVPGSRDLLPT